MADTDRLAKEIAGILRSSGSRQTKAYDTPAEVKRIDGGTAWVHIPGGVDETPVQLTVAAEPGDTVQVRVSGGTAWIVGNASAPPTDDKAARAAQATADVAVTEAEAASEMSAEARQVARAAAKIAGDTEQHFWFTETGADTGAHITEKTQEDFLADPDNGGGNLLARSNGIAVRDGLAELAQFSGTGTRLYTRSDDGSTLPVMDITSTGQSKQIYFVTRDFEGPVTAGEIKTVVSTLNNPVGTIHVFVRYPYSADGFYSTNLPVGTAAGRSGSIPGVNISIQYDGSDSITTVLTAPDDGGAPMVYVEVYRTETHDAPYYNIGTRAGDIGAFSAVVGESLYAEEDNEIAVGAYNEPNVQNRLFSVGGNNAVNPKDLLKVDRYGHISFNADVIRPSELRDLGWDDSLDTNTLYNMIQIDTLLGHILDFIWLIDMPLVTNKNWSSGTLTVPGSSKYRVFEVIQGGSSVLCERYGNYVYGSAISGNTTSGNYNQYARTFSASADWSTEVWTLRWAKQLSHVTTSGYHTSGTEQAITEIRGLIPLRGAFIE